MGKKAATNTSLVHLGKRKRKTKENTLATVQPVNEAPSHEDFSKLPSPVEQHVATHPVPSKNVSRYKLLQQKAQETVKLAMLELEKPKESEAVKNTVTFSALAAPKTDTDSDDDSYHNSDFSLSSLSDSEEEPDKEPAKLTIVPVSKVTSHLDLPPRINPATYTPPVITIPLPEQGDVTPDLEEIEERKDDEEVEQELREVEGLLEEYRAMEEEVKEGFIDDSEIIPLAEPLPKKTKLPPYMPDNKEKDELTIDDIIKIGCLKFVHLIEKRSPKLQGTVERCKKDPAWNGALMQCRKKWSKAYLKKLEPEHLLLGATVFIAMDVYDDNVNNSPQ